mmetsp:Transcript_60761/g.190974  ORF Transcript_60761/g.190974 Transcript_60761/m.190974 type:complete len:284 (-) Transcript_60761:840-1691(-)
MEGARSRVGGEAAGPRGSGRSCRGRAPLEGAGGGPRGQAGGRGGRGIQGRAAVEGQGEGLGGAARRSDAGSGARSARWARRARLRRQLARALGGAGGRGEAAGPHRRFPRCSVQPAHGGRACGPAAGPHLGTAADGTWPEARTLRRGGLLGRCRGGDPPGQRGQGLPSGAAPDSTAGRHEAGRPRAAEAHGGAAGRAQVPSWGRRAGGEAGGAERAVRHRRRLRRRRSHPAVAVPRQALGRRGRPRGARADDPAELQAGCLLASAAHQHGADDRAVEEPESET